MGTRTTPLSRERIVAAAVALLDQHGPDHLTMRRLAQSLDVTSTALYWHVQTKDDLVDLAFDEIFARVPQDATDDWRNDARTLLRAWRAAMLRHPWAPALVGRTTVGPHVRARTQFLQATLTRGGFTGLALAATTRLLANYVIGSALTESTWREPARQRAEPWNDDELFERGLDTIVSRPGCGR